MIAVLTPFDPKRDLQDVDQFGFVDLHHAIENGVVPSDLSVSEDVYNGIDDPRSIMGKPRDVFEAMQFGHVISVKSENNAPTS